MIDDIVLDRTGKYIGVVTYVDLSIDPETMLQIDPYILINDDYEVPMGQVEVIINLVNPCYPPSYVRLL